MAVIVTEPSQKRGKKKVLSDIELRTMVDDRKDRIDAKPPFKTRCRMFTACIRFRWNENNDMFEVQVLNYQEDGRQGNPIFLKFPGGCSNEGELAWQCLQREMLAETGRKVGLRKSVGENGIEVTQPAEIIYHRIFHYPDNFVGEVPANGIEHVHIFFTEEISFHDKGKFFKTRTGSDNNECGPVYWKLLDQDLVNNIFKSHRPALEKLHEKLMNDFGTKDAAKGFALQNIRF